MVDWRKLQTLMEWTFLGMSSVGWKLSPCSAQSAGLAHKSLGNLRNLLQPCESEIDTVDMLILVTHIHWFLQQLTQLLSFIVDWNNICALDWRNCFQLKLTGERPGEPPPVQHGHGWSRENGSNVIIMYYPVGWVKMYYFQFLKLQSSISLSICQ